MREEAVGGRNCAACYTKKNNNNKITHTPRRLFPRGSAGRQHPTIESQFRATYHSPAATAAHY